MPTTTSEEVKRPHTQMDGDEPVQKKPKHENEIVSFLIEIFEIVNISKFC